MSQKVQNPSVVLENRDNPKTIGLDTTSTESIEQYADALSSYSKDLQSQYGFDNILKSDEGTPYDALDGAAAFYRAIKRITGLDPVGIPWGQNPPILRDLQIQEFQYLFTLGPDQLAIDKASKDGTNEELVTDHELNDPGIWPVRRIVEYLASRGYEVPSYFSDADREAMLEKLMGTLELVGAPVRTIHVPWGAVKIPGMKGVEVFVTEESGESFGYNRPVFRLAVLAKRKHAATVDMIVDTVKDELKQRSIFKNRCYYYNDGQPVFFDPFTVRPEEIILPESLQGRLDNELIAVIRNMDEARTLDPSLTRGRYLLAGKPGTGKTEYTKIIAQQLLKNSITACFMKAGTVLEDVQRFMARNAPAFGVLEDVEAYFPDSEASRKEQKLERSALTALFDGTLSKGQEVAWLLTTNFPEQFDEAMSRQGRVDGYFVFSSLDANGFARLVRMKLGDRLADDVDFAKVWEHAGDMSSAFLGGLVKIALKYTLGKPDYVLTTEDLVLIVSGLRGQWEWHVLLGELEKAGRERSLREEVSTLLGPIVDASLDKRFATK